MTTVKRFLKYVTFETTSNEDNASCPSFAGERVFGEYLAKELSAIGLSGVRIDENGYVYGFIPASKGCEGLPAVGFIAHMDTSPDASGKDVKARILRYEGGDIALGAGQTITRSVFPVLEKYEGKELIVTDGTTLLGADDKAGIAEIVSMAESLLADPGIKHGKIAVAFTPDEEIGRGADLFDVASFGCAYAYTVDGGEIIDAAVTTS